MMTTETTWGEGVRMMIKINRLSLVNIYFVDDNFNDQMMRREKNEKKKKLDQGQSYQRHREFGGNLQLLYSLCAFVWS
jgi:hypothetical protein